MRLIRALIVAIYVASSMTVVLVWVRYFATRHVARPELWCAVVALFVALVADVLTRRTPPSPNEAEFSDKDVK